MEEDRREVIIPQYKVIISYDVVPSNHEAYFRFMMSELVPMMQEQGIYMTEVWHTAHGDYPLRMAAFVTEDMETVQELLNSDRWQELESQFKSYTRNYHLYVVPYRQGFQFVR